MTDFEKLQHMDMQEIHKKTRITIARLHDIINKNFDSLESPTTTRGFIRILERELRLDLTDLLEEYDKYTKQKHILQEIEANYQVDSVDSANNDDKNPPMMNNNTESIAQTAYTPQKPKEMPMLNIEVGTMESSSQLKWIGISTTIAVAIIIFLYIIASSDSSDSAKKQPINADTQQAQQVITHNVQPPQAPSQNLNNASNDSQQQSTTNASRDRQETIEDMIDTNNDNTANTDSTNTLVITPKSELWFAYVDTTTKKRLEKYTKTPYTIELSNPTVFHFGNGLFILDLDGKEFGYNQQSVTYVLYTPGEGFNLITQKQYRELTK